MNKSVKNPVTEQCLAGDYKYLEENDINDDLAKEQLEAGQRLFGLRNAESVPRCNCQVSDGRSCHNNACSNRKINSSIRSDAYSIVILACPPTCFPECRNNPWATKSFAIDNKKLYKKTVEGKGDGLFALDRIAEGEYIGEYRGKILSDQIILDEKRKCYSFKIPITRHIIDAYKQGSAMRFINNSCEPNSEAVYFFHNGIFKLVFVAVKKIEPGMEITVNYGWEFFKGDVNPICLCGSASCSKFIGVEKAEFYGPPLQMPAIFTSSVVGLDNIVVHTQDVYDQYFLENHVFGENEIVYAVCLDSSKLGVAKYRVVQSYLNSYGFFFYKIQRAQLSNAKPVYVPMFTVFKFKENAAKFVRDISDSDEVSLRSFITSTSRVWKKLQQLKVEVVPDYVAKLRNLLLKPEDKKEERGECPSTSFTESAAADAEDVVQKKPEATLSSVTLENEKKLTIENVDTHKVQKSDDSPGDEFDKTINKLLDPQLDTDNEQKVNKSKEEENDDLGLRNFKDDNSKEELDAEDTEEEESEPENVIMEKEEFILDDDEEDEDEDEQEIEEPEVVTLDDDESEKTVDKKGKRAIQKEEPEVVTLDDGDDEEEDYNFIKQDEHEKSDLNIFSSEEEDDNVQRNDIQDEMEGSEDDHGRNDSNINLKEVEYNTPDDEKVNPDETLRKIITDSANPVMLRRLLEQAKEGVSQFLMYRIKKDGRNITFDEAYSAVSPVLENFYFNMDTKKRRFLLQDEYWVANEIAGPGSLIWRWCSLCQLEEGFFNYVNFLQHYYDYHAICHGNFICSDHDFKTGLLEKFLNHVEEHHKDVKIEHLDALEFKSQLYRALSDFIAMRKGSLLLLKTGMPSSKGLKRSIISKGVGSFKIDLTAKRAENVDLHRTVFLPQSYDYQIIPRVDQEMDDELQQGNSKRQKAKVLRYNEPKTKNPGTISTCPFVTNGPPVHENKVKLSCRSKPLARMTFTQNPIIVDKINYIGKIAKPALKTRDNDGRKKANNPSLCIANTRGERKKKIANQKTMNDDATTGQFETVTRRKRSIIFTADQTNNADSEKDTTNVNLKRKNDFSPPKTNKKKRGRTRKTAVLSQ